MTRVESWALDVYCDGHKVLGLREDCTGMDPALVGFRSTVGQFSGQSKATAHKRAKAAGWTIGQTYDLCPECAEKVRAKRQERKHG